MTSQSLLKSSAPSSLWRRFRLAELLDSRVPPFCAFCASLWLPLCIMNHHLSAWRRRKLGAIINHLAAKESLFYHAAQEFPRVRRQLVTMVDHSRLDAKFFHGIPDHDVGIAANGNRAFPLLQTNQTS